ncbi:DUF4244 domain-containing protein [Streptomyces sp. MUM 203J]|uniref:DUF4244 domain-containing protein n=1 Tax=Streptomyces sp. MUM 203J TaxID=2791990 RepID=UPI0023D8EC7B|nr:DUF4244 domain-containing protein [Streptomyces sp. MUM 203J]MCH0541502.1 DUF4244 domain-containing protein [Streptomyces sp. MUM 203J]
MWRYVRETRLWARGRWGRAREALRGVAGAWRNDAGMNTAEYAMGTIAACAFAAVLYKVVTSDAVSAGVQGVIGRALDAPF